jgi:hypothetical protein
VSDAHAEGDGHSPVGPVALIVGPGDRFLSGVSYYTALLTSALIFGVVRPYKGYAELAAAPEVSAESQDIQRARPLVVGSRERNR